MQNRLKFYFNFDNMFRGRTGLDTFFGWLIALIIIYAWISNGFAYWQILLPVLLVVFVVLFVVSNIMKSIFKM